MLKLLIEDLTPSSLKKEDPIQPLPTAASSSPRTTSQIKSVTSPQIEMSTPIPLERVDEGLLDADAVEELLNASPSSSSSTSASAPSRFTAFVPPDLSRITETQSRNVSITNTVADTPRSLFTVGHGVSRGSSSGSDEAVETQTGDHSESGTLSNRMTGSRILNDWPDPYGINPTPSMGTRTSSAPPQSESKTSSSSMLLPAIGMDGAMRTLTRSPLRDALPPATSKGKTHGFDEVAWSAYWKGRCGRLLRLWQSYIDDVCDVL